MIINFTVHVETISLQIQQELDSMQKFTPNQLLWKVSIANILSKTIEVLSNDDHSWSNYHSVYVNIFSIYVVTLNHDTK
jgi:hypothetical protein